MAMVIENEGVKHSGLRIMLQNQPLSVVSFLCITVRAHKYFSVDRFSSFSLNSHLRCTEVSAKLCHGLQKANNLLGLLELKLSTLFVLGSCTESWCGALWSSFAAFLWLRDDLVTLPSSLQMLLIIITHQRIYGFISANYLRLYMCLLMPSAVVLSFNMSESLNCAF